MKITAQPNIAPMAPLIRKANASSDKPVSKLEQSDVSTTAQLLGKNQSQLENRLSPREEVIQRFSGNLTDSVTLQERTIDLIIQRLKNS